MLTLAITACEKTERELKEKFITKCAKKGGGVILRKTPLVVPLFFYDWYSEGFGGAVNEATWPASMLWD
tara:strand:- start:70 stop:276 length:207 start_codon:yes stop_codon:yes gene_type:complete